MTVLPAGLGVLTAPFAATATAGTDRLLDNEQLDPNERLITSNGIVLVTQGDGNLVEYPPGDRAVWASGTNRADAATPGRQRASLWRLTASVSAWLSVAGRRPRDINRGAK